MLHVNSRIRHTVILGAIAGLGLTLGACSSGSSSTTSVPDPSSTAGPVATSTQGAGAPSGAASGDFCSQAVASIAASKETTTATDKLDSAISDPKSFTSGDMTSIHELSQKILDSAKVASAFYASGAANATDPDAKAAFKGLSDFTAQYSVPLAQAGLDAKSMSDYVTSMTSMVANPELTPLLEKVPEWAVVISNYTQKECNITAATGN
jgi:hypothetical protein